MKELLTDFAGLNAYIKSSDKGYLDALRAYYKMVGEDAGFTVVIGAQIITNSVDFGKVDMAWVESNVLFAFEFGKSEDAYKHLFKFMVAKPALGVMITSSKSSLKPNKVKEMIEATDELSGIKIIDLDVGEGREA